MLIATASTAAAADAIGGDDLRPALLDVTVNGQRSEEPLLFLRGADGSIYASEAAFTAWRLRRPAIRPVLFEGEKYYRINAYVDTRFSAQDQSLVIQAPATLFQAQLASLETRETLPMAPRAAGAFLNYDLFAERVSGRTSLNGALELGISTRHGVLETSAIGFAGNGKARAVRLETSFTIDRPANATTLRVGDSISAGGPGGAPVRFAGLHYHRNYATQPGFITMPLPTIAGEAAVPSVVDIYVNNALRDRLDVAPGPFELSDIPVHSGGGTVQLVVRDLLGREIISEQSYYASSRLLRRGIHDFSWEAGFVREEFGSSSFDYGELMASTTHRYGVSDRLTLEGHAEASRSIQMASGALTWLAFDLGQMGLSVAASRSDEGGFGWRASAGLERRTRRYSLGITGEYASRDYGYIGMPERFRPPRTVVQAYGDVIVGPVSIGANLLYRRFDDRPDETIASATARFRVGRHMAVNVFGRRTVAGRSDTIVGATLTVGFGGRRSASALVEHGDLGSQATVNYQYDPPYGQGSGYRIQAGTGRSDRIEGTFVHLFPSATVQAQIGHVNGETGVRLSASGSIGMIGGQPFAARRIGQSFGEVRVDGYQGVRVYAENQLVGITDEKGRVVVPDLRAFDRNEIRIEEADLPMDAMLETNALEVRPYGGAGAIIRFPVHRERGVLMQVLLADGRPLPAGSTVLVGETGEAYIVASGGEVYVPDLGGRATLRAVWEGGTCSFEALVPANDDPQPRLDGLVCREPIYAAH